MSERRRERGNREGVGRGKFLCVRGKDLIVLLCVQLLWCVMHCVAVCCSVLQCVAACCSALQCVAVCCGLLQCVAVCCSVIATSNPLKDLKRLSFQSMYSCVMQCVAVSCSVLQ